MYKIGNKVLDMKNQRKVKRKWQKKYQNGKCGRKLEKARVPSTCKIREREKRK